VYDDAVTTDAVSGGTVSGADLVLVSRADRQIRDEELPDPADAHGAHRVGLAVPLVVVAHHTDGGGVGRPDREGDALFAVVRAGVGPEGLPEALVTSFRDQVQVEIAERRTMAVGVAGHGLLMVRIAGGDPIGQRRTDVLSLPDAVGHMAELEPAAVAEHGRHSGGERASDADHGDRAIGGVLARMCPEHGMRIVVRR